jgi:hypothetical protein
MQWAAYSTRPQQHNGWNFPKRVALPSHIEWEWESAMGVRRVLRVLPPAPLGDVTLVPAPLSGRAESEMARAMAAALAEFDMPSATDVLSRLRQAFPLAPFAARVGALGIMMERRWRAM